MAKKYTPELFWAKVDKTGGEDACWLWLGHTNPAGYGQLRYNGVDVTSHRLAAYLYGMLDKPTGPEDRKGSGFILHQCDNPPCCNPAHFKVGTSSENLREAIDRGLMRYNFGAAHHQTVVTDEQVVEIRRRWPSETQASLAKEFGVTQACISLITRRINRAHIGTGL